MAEQAECDGNEIGYDSNEQIASVEECAERCKGVSSMFVFGTNDFGNPRCNDKGCYCICETAAKIDGTCTQIEHTGYRLYKYKNPG